MITFENIRTGETINFNAAQDPSARQAHMAAYLNSSNLSPNALKGQDFGWRLSPELVAQIEFIKTDLDTLSTIARQIGVGIDEIQDFHILNYVANKEFSAEAIKQRALEDNPIYKQEYEARLKKIREESNTASGNIQAPIKKEK